MLVTTLTKFDEVRRAWSIEDKANAIGVSRQTYSSWIKAGKEVLIRKSDNGKFEAFPKHK